MTRERYYRPFLLLVLLAAVAIMAALLWPFHNAVLLALIVASILYPARNRLTARLGGRKILASLLLTLATVLFVFVPLGLLAGALATEAAFVVDMTVEWVKSGEAQALLDKVRLGYMPGWAQDLMARFPVDFSEIQSRIVATVGSLGSVFLTFGRGVASTTVDILFQFAMMVLFLFYLLAQGDELAVQARRASPLRPDQGEALFSRFKTMSQANLLGGLATSFAQGIAVGVGLAIAGISPFFWGAVAVVASLIPFVGLALIMIPAILYLLATGSIKSGIFLLVYWQVVINTIDNVVRPLFLHGKAKMSLIWVFVSVVGGLMVFGPLGILYGPISLSLAFAVFEIFLADMDKPEATLDPPAPGGGAGPDTR